MQDREGGARCAGSEQHTVLLTRNSGRVTLGKSRPSLGFRLSSVQRPCSRPFRVDVQTRRGARGKPSVGQASNLLDRILKE